MTTKGLQFHATIEDISDMVALLRLVEPEIHVYFWLKTKEVIDYPQQGNVDIDSRMCNLIVASVDHISLPLVTSSLTREYPGIFLIEVPRIEDGTLREVSVGAMTQDERGLSQFKVWDRFIRRFRKQLHSGAFVSNPQTNAGAYYKNAHATWRALEAARKGLVLKAAAGNCVYDYEKS